MLTFHPIKTYANEEMWLIVSFTTITGICCQGNKDWIWQCRNYQAPSIIFNTAWNYRDPKYFHINLCKISLYNGEWELQYIHKNNGESKSLTDPFLVLKRNWLKGAFLKSCTCTPATINLKRIEESSSEGLFCYNTKFVAQVLPFTQI